MSEENVKTQATPEETQATIPAHKLIQKMFPMIDLQKLMQQKMML